MFKNILVAVDLEDGTHIDNLLGVASRIANIFGANVHLLHVIAAGPAVVSQFLPESFESMASKKVEKDLSALVEKVNLVEGTVDISIRFGGAYQEILACATKIDADLIIISSHKPNVGDYLLGTTAARIVRHASCSALVVRQTG